MAEQLAKRRAKPLKRPVGPNVLIIEQRTKKTVKKPAAKQRAAKKAAPRKAAPRKAAKKKSKTARRAK
jgi:hypothetical protein